MQSRVCQVGPLASGSATKIGLSQTPTAAGALVLNGAAGSFTANNICLSQTTAGATPLVLNGALASGTPKVAWLPNPPSYIYLTSAGDDSGITFAVVGLDINNVSQTETLAGTNASVVASTKLYSRILSITPSGATSASGVTVGTMGTAKLDVARQVILTSGGNDSGITFTIYGTDWSGTPISETVTGANTAAATSVLDYLTVTKVVASAATASTIEIGTNGVAHSPWINLDSWAFGATTVQCAISGTVSYNVESSNDDPNYYANPISPASMSWDDKYALGSSTAQTTEIMASMPSPPVWIRVLLNSGSGTVRMTVVQQGNAPY